MISYPSLQLSDLIFSCSLSSHLHPSRPRAHHICFSPTDFALARSSDHDISHLDTCMDCTLTFISLLQDKLFPQNNGPPPHSPQSLFFLPCTTFDTFCHTVYLFSIHFCLSPIRKVSSLTLCNSLLYPQDLEQYLAHCSLSTNIE